ncbi:Hypothetical protein WLH_05702 (plasmid) [Escherichia coli O25b:H4]|uniref:Uncharacterized protein n=1 Tax=Escherichia coli O25b:H4 TaxID=941280 RepID=A0A192CL80_ECO25|nr:Hypothetical protein WLH_05702 [Escherichia coli O25b:H4]
MQAYRAMVNSYSLSDDSGVMAAAAITHFLFGQAVFSYLNGWSVLIRTWYRFGTARAANTKGFNGPGGVHGFYRDVSVQGLLIISWLGGSRHTMTVRKDPVSQLSQLRSPAAVQAAIDEFVQLGRTKIPGAPRLRQVPRLPGT